MKQQIQSIVLKIKAVINSVLNSISGQLSRLKRTKKSKSTPELNHDDNPQTAINENLKPSFFSKAKSLSAKMNLKDQKDALIQKSNEPKDKAKQTIENIEDLKATFKTGAGSIIEKSKDFNDKIAGSNDGNTELNDEDRTESYPDKLSKTKDTLSSKLEKLTGESGTLGKDSLAKSKESLLNASSGLQDKLKGLNKVDGLLGDESMAKSKDKLLNTTVGLKAKFRNINHEDGLLGQESNANSKEKLKNLSSTFKDKLGDLKDSDSSVIQKLKALPVLFIAFVGRFWTGTKKTITHIKNADVSEIGKAASPLFTKWSQFSLKVASLPWITNFIDKWMTLKVWGKEKLFYRYTMPTLVGVCSIFLLVTSVLFFITRSSISSLRNNFGSEMVESKRQEKIQKHTNHITERSDEIEQIMRDNVNKTSLLANSPTFQQLNVQGMEEFSRTLLQKDTNLLNVVVLTHEEVKANIRTRRIGEETDFIFSCCELNEDRSINYEEIDEVDWLYDIDSTQEVVTDVFRNPVNNERFFYHASNITDFKGTQNGAVLLRYNLNFAVRNLQKSNIGGVNFLVTNDSTVIASSQDSIFPIIKTLSMTDAASSGPVDYFSRIAGIMNKAKTPGQAISQLTDAKFIGDPVRFERKFGEVLPGQIAIEPTLDSLGEGTWLTVEQAEAILDLKFGQLLKLNGTNGDGNFTPGEMEMLTGRVLASAYLDSIKTVGNGYILDENYLLTFSTNEFGWTLINQSTSDEFYGDIYKAEQEMKAQFGGLNRNVLLTFLISTLLLLGLFSLLITGFMKKFTRPIKEILDEVNVNPSGLQPALEVTSGNEMELIGQRFRSMNNEIESYVSLLEKSNLELEQYAHVVSHDLRAPLRTIGSFTQLLEQKLDSGIADEKAKSYMTFIQKGAAQMEDMIRGMLSYATLKRKLTADDYTEIDLNIQLQNALDNLKEKIEETKPEISFKELPIVRFKSENVVSVFQNLIDNAIKYRNPEDQLKIEINSQHIGENYIVSIKDNGLGIDFGSREKVFDMFYRSGDQAESIGIGLSTCKTIMDNGGGKIWIDTEENQESGTTFFISFPNGVTQHKKTNSEDIKDVKESENTDLFIDENNLQNA